MKTKLYLGLTLLASLCVLLLVTRCSKADFGKNVILAGGTETSPIVKFAVAGTPANYSVTATATQKASEDINVTFALDTSAVAAYNKEHNTTYFAAPAAAINISGLSAVIKAGSSASTPVIVTIVSTSPLKDGRSYLIPLTIKTITGGDMSVLESSRTIFLRIARIMGFPALSMNNSNAGTTGSPGTRGRFNACALFDPANPVLLPNFTLEIKNLIYAFRGGDGNTNPQPIQSLLSWTDQMETTSIGLRYGELGNPNNSLQLIGSAGQAFAYGFNTNQWYTISLTYDGNKCVMYVDGNPVAATPSAASFVLRFSRLTLGQTWGGYDTKQYVNGRIAECRVWSRALTSSEIKLNLCGADPNASGLLAYWKLNDGSGSIFHNSSTAGSKYDMDWTKVWWDLAGAGDDKLVLADKSAYVTWTNDNLNTCSQ
ncbi:MAG: DUF1735 domain-containing protein [Bacteroidia bacterium]|nr:DUF1735 domain-containing protein [Bacteroidia bacterium]